MGWNDGLVIRPGTRLDPAQKRELVRTVRRAARDGKLAPSAQQTIPYEEMQPDGVCRLGGGLYSRSVLFGDIGYAEASQQRQVAVLSLFRALLNSFGPEVGIQLSVVRCLPDRAQLCRLLELPARQDAAAPLCREFGDMLVEKSSLCRFEHRLCLTFTVRAGQPAQACARLEQIEQDVLSQFRAMGAEAAGMDGWQRLSLLHRCFHLYSEAPLRFNWDALVHTGLSSKDFIAPSSFCFSAKRSFETDNWVGAASFLQISASQLSDRFLHDLMETGCCQLAAIHARAVEQNAALKLVKRKLSDLDRARIDEQKRAVRSGFDMDILPPDLVTYSKEANRLLEDIQNRDERLFNVTVLLVHAARTRRELESCIASAEGIANAANCHLVRLDYQQEEGYLSALPLGVNLVDIQRTLTTSAASALLPFYADELVQPGGLYYGVNALTGRLLLADRRRLKCPNGIVLGSPGSGKSFFAKREILHVHFSGSDDQLILDPENEYTSLTQALDGQVIYLAPDSHSYLNPMDIDLDTDVGESPLLMQADFLLSQCELMMAAGGETLRPVERSVLDRCIRLVYRDYIQSPSPDRMPVLGDLYRAVRQQPEECAANLAAAMEIYVSGSLSYLNHRTNVDPGNRLVCYNTSRLGQGLKKLVMSNVQKHIWQRTTVNRYAGKTTRIVLDEFHLLLKEPQTAAYTAEIYKRFRKWNGIPTALTQNIKDLLASSEIENILENSDFILMLNQGAGDRQILAQRLNISDAQLAHVTNSPEGEGLLFFGDKILPFTDRFPKDTQLYRAMTTKPSEQR